MIFNSPQFLWALGLAALPIIIHLFQLRRFKKIYFPDISLLKEIQSKSQTKNQLRHLLILASRLAFLTLLVLAFCEPIIPTDTDGSDQKESLVSIYVDNSFSMQGESESGENFQRAIQSAFDIVEAFPPSTKYQLIANDFASYSRRTLDKDQLIRELDNLQLSPLSRNMSDVIDLRSTVFMDDGELDILSYFISDFNAFVDSGIIQRDSTRKLSLIPIQNQINQNLSIDSTWLSNPITQVGIEQVLNFRVTNHGTNPEQELKVDIYFNDELIGSPLLSIEPNSYADTSIVFIPDEVGIIQGELRLEDYPIQYDNQYYLVIDVEDQIPVVEIGDINADSPFESLYSGQQFKYIMLDEEAILLDSLNEGRLLIFNQLNDWNTGIDAIIDDAINSSLHLLFILSEDPSESYVKAMRDRFSVQLTDWDTANLEVNRIAEDDDVFRDVFEKRQANMNYPSVNGHWRVGAESLMSPVLELYNGDPLLTRIRVDKSNIFFVTAPLSDAYTSFHRHALFVPAMINIAARSGSSRKMAYQVGTTSIKGKFDSDELRLIRNSDSSSIIPGLNYGGLLLGDQLLSEGHYTLYNAQNELLAAYAFNFDRTESMLQEADLGGIEQYLTSKGYLVDVMDIDSSKLTQVVSKASLDVELWPLFIALALLFLILETVLLKRFTS